MGLFSTKKTAERVEAERIQRETAEKEKALSAERAKTLNKIKRVEKSLAVGPWRNFWTTFVPFLYFVAAMIFAGFAVRVFFGGESHNPVVNEYAKRAIDWIASFGDLWLVAGYLLAAVIAASIGYVKVSHKNYRVIVKTAHLKEVLALHKNLLMKDEKRDVDLKKALADVAEAKRRHAELEAENKRIFEELPRLQVEEMMRRVELERRKRDQSPQVGTERRQPQLPPQEKAQAQLPPPEEVPPPKEIITEEPPTEVAEEIPPELPEEAVFEEDTADSIEKIAEVLLPTSPPQEAPKPKKKGWFKRLQEWEKKAGI